MDDDIMLNFGSSNDDFLEKLSQKRHRSHPAKARPGKTQKESFNEGGTYYHMPSQTKGEPSSSMSSLTAEVRPRPKPPNAMPGLLARKRKWIESDDPSKSSSKPARRIARQPTDKKPSQPISSLFRGNPEIPRLVSSTKVEACQGAEPGENSCSRLKKQKTQSGGNFSCRLKKQKLLSVKQTFDELAIVPRLVANLDSTFHMSKPTSVQSVTIPVLLKGRDALVQSQTGSGKTLAYCLPLVQQLSEADPRVTRVDGPLAIVLLPTRELAVQSFNVIHKLIKCCCWLVPGCLVGGEKKKAEKARIRKGLNIVVATPGRLLDHIQHTNTLILSRVQWLVLDEADRLLDLGFEKDVSKIIEELNKVKDGVHRQNVLLSATLNNGVQRLASVSLERPKFIDMTQLASVDDVTGDGSDSKFVAPSTLCQHFLFAPSKLRLVALAAFIRSETMLHREGKVIVFVSSRDSVDFHHGLFERLFDKEAKDDPALSQIHLLKLHGSMSQLDRSQVFKEFSAIKSGVLFSTDVAARGLDLPQVNWIVQYTPPQSTADYVHRIGRTARIGQEGSALLFLLPSEAEYLRILKEHGMEVEEMSLQSLLRTLVRRKASESVVESAATYLQLECERIVMDDDFEIIATAACLSYVRAYGTYPYAIKHIFHIKQLHLGHTAKSFALRRTPTQLGLTGRSQSERKRPKQVEAEREWSNKRDSGASKKSQTNDVAVRKKPRLYVSEHSRGVFSGPMPGGKKKTKKKKKGKG